VSNPQTPESKLPAPAAKALLLCGHAEELSHQCVTAIRHRLPDRLLELQSRKHTVIQELATILRGIDVKTIPPLEKAVEILRATLRSETTTLAEASEDARNKLLTLNAAQRRLDQARRYHAATQSRWAAGTGGSGQFSACG